MNKFGIYKCSYCKCLKIGKKKYYEENLICSECLKIVPRWTSRIREELNKIKEST